MIDTGMSHIGFRCVVRDTTKRALGQWSLLDWCSLHRRSHGGVEMIFADQVQDTRLG